MSVLRRDLRKHVRAIQILPILHADVAPGELALRVLVHGLHGKLCIRHMAAAVPAFPLRIFLGKQTRCRHLRLLHCLRERHEAQVGALPLHRKKLIIGSLLDTHLLPRHIPLLHPELDLHTAHSFKTRFFFGFASNLVPHFLRSFCILDPKGMHLLKRHNPLLHCLVFVHLVHLLR